MRRILVCSYVKNYLRARETTLKKVILQTLQNLGGKPCRFPYFLPFFLCCWCVDIFSITHIHLVKVTLGYGYSSWSSSTTTVKIKDLKYTIFSYFLSSILNIHIDGSQLIFGRRKKLYTFKHIIHIPNI